SRGSSRGRYAPTASPSVSVEVMSLAEWTATSIRPSSSASSSSFTNTPRAPICALGRAGARSRAPPASARAGCRATRPGPASAPGVVEPEQVPDGLRVAAAARAGGGLLQPHRRQVQQLVDDPRCHRLDLGLLRRRQAEPGARPLELGRAHLLRPRAQGGDLGYDLARGEPLAEALRLRSDDRLRPSGLAAAARQARGDDRLEVVDVVEEAPVELVDRRVEVTRNGEVDQEQRP